MTNQPLIIDHATDIPLRCEALNDLLAAQNETYETVRGKRLCAGWLRDGIVRFRVELGGISSRGDDADLMERDVAEHAADIFEQMADEQEDREVNTKSK